MGDEAPRYRFGPRSTRGLVAGWRGGQIACVAVAAVVALGLLKSIGGAGGALAAVLVTVVGVAAAAWPIQGRTCESWAPTILRYGAARAADGHLAPWKATGRRRGCVSRLEVRSMSGEGGRPLGVVEDREASTWTAVLAVGGTGFALAGELAQADAVAAWSGVLAALAAEGRGLRRVQWIARSYPVPLGVDRAWPGGSGARHARGPRTAYESLVSEVTSSLWDREVLVGVTTAAPRSSIGPGRREEAETTAARRLCDLLATLASRLSSAGLLPSPPFDERQLSLALRRSHDLAEPAGKTAYPFPLGVEARWAALRTDASWQATYWISEWPRGDVGPAVLLPLLLGDGARRTVSLILAPLPAVRAVRRAEHERTSGAADVELRRRHGFTVTARARREQESRSAREAELAEGHAAYLFSGYVTVSAGDEPSLASACAEVEQLAALSQLELRRLYGAQEEGWCCTLPAGRGCG